MLKKHITYLFILLGFCLSAQKLKDYDRKIFGKTMQEIEILTSEPDSGFYLDDLILKLFRPDSSVSDKELAYGYYGYTLLPDYNPQKYIGLELQVMQLNDAFETKKAMKFADSLVTKYPTCLMGHVELSYAYNRLQDTVKAAVFRNVYERLVNMILKTGDGKSYETSYVITGIKDIEVITQIERMQLLNRKSKSKKKRTYEVVTVFKNYKKETIIFDTTLLTQLGGV